MSSGDFRQRVDRVRDRVDIVSVIGRAITLGKGDKPRGKCPFHGSKSDSFAVDRKHRSAKCWGCGWSGDVVRFVQDHFGLTFKEALERLESENGLADLAAAPAHREKLPADQRPGRKAREDAPRVDSLEMGLWLVEHAGRELSPVRTYLNKGRGVPAEMLTPRRLRDVRFIERAPLFRWKVGEDPRKLPHAPAMLALIRKAPCAGDADEVKPWRIIGVHVTYLNPAFDGKMIRRKADGELYPSRKMFGEAGGGGLVMPGAEHCEDSALFVGEGIETVLCGMHMNGAHEAARGLAVLSLDNLQGKWRERAGAIPLYDPEPDPERLAVSFFHDGPVTVLVDADMKPLQGFIDPRTGNHRGLRLIERRHGPIVKRAMTSAERSDLCGALAVKCWRAAGCRSVRAVRPAMGQDFNDAVREIGR